MLVRRGSALGDVGDECRLAAIGAFDGVHVGHRALIDELVARARAAGGLALVVTFDPHPSRVVAPNVPLPLLMTPQAKAAAVAALGADVMVEIPFDRELAAMEPEDFAARVLRRGLDAREVLVGFNFTFGRGGRGDAALLRRLGPGLGFATTILPPVSVDGVVASSTAIRGLVQDGAVARAAALLGRPYELEGQVRAGSGRGRGLGFPTANVDLPGGLVWPAPGVYAVLAREGPATPLPAVANVGVRPTFEDGARGAGDGARGAGDGVPPLLEVHVIGGRRDLYGKRLCVGFVARLREERRFPSAAALARQIARDVRAAERALAGHRSAGADLQAPRSVLK